MSKPFKQGEFIYESIEDIKKSYRTKGDRNNIEKRRRVKLTKEQIDRLSYYFEMNCMPQLNDRVLIGNEIGVNQKTVQIWFQNRRAKIKKNERDQYEIDRFHGTDFSGFLPHDLPDLEVCNNPDSRFSIPLFYPPLYDNSLVYEPNQGNLYIPSGHINHNNIVSIQQYTSNLPFDNQFRPQNSWLYQDHGNYNMRTDISKDNEENQKLEQIIEPNDKLPEHFKGSNNSYEHLLEDQDFFYN